MTGATIQPSALTARLLHTIGNRIASSDPGKSRLCILNYHRVLPEPDPLLESEPDVAAFRWQMALLAQSFNVLPLADAIALLGRKALPPRAVCITFDDGYRSTYELALPVLKEFGLPATVFVTTGHLAGGSMWNDRIAEAIRHLPDGSLDLRDVGLGVRTLQTLADRGRLVQQLTEDAKYLEPTARLNVSRKLEQLAGKTEIDGLMLTRENVKALAENGIEIGGHTVTHPILTSLENEKARWEIEQGKRELEDIIGKPLRVFAYPNGKVGVDFDERHVKMAQDAGFEAAFTTARGAATARHERYQIPRSRPWDKTPFYFGLRLLTWLAGSGR